MTSDQKILWNCEVCGSTDISSVLNLGKHPLCDDLVEIGNDRRCELFEIEIALCQRCLTAHQMHPVPKRQLFPKSYHYRANLTQDVLKGMKGLVETISESYGPLSGKTVLDVGCNDGSLLNLFRSQGAKVFGIEPTGAAQDARDMGIEVLNDFFDPSSARQILVRIGSPDYITFTNVFAHIENLAELIESVRILRGSKTRIVIENHYLGAVADRFQFDTFYHEHPRTYSATSFVHVANRLNSLLELVDFPSRYGGNIRVIIGPQSEQNSAEIQNILKRETNITQKFVEMRRVIAEWQSTRNELLKWARSTNGKVYAKAFPGRAAILIHMLGLGNEDIEAIFEQPNSKKIGYYAPGTRIPILSDGDLLKLVPKPRRLLNLAWHIGPEIRTYLSGLDAEIECKDIFPPTP